MRQASRRTFLKRAGLLGAAALAPRALRAQLAATARPNFVIVLIDDMGWKDVGFMGNTFVETPNIDKLAREGMVFTSAYANAPNCAPTRACIILGQYTPRHGVYTVGDSVRGPTTRQKLIPASNSETLPDSTVTIAEALKPAGYASACIGMWNLGRSRDADHSPIGEGFDLYVNPRDLGFDQDYYPGRRDDDGGDGRRNDASRRGGPESRKTGRGRGGDKGGRRGKPKVTAKPDDYLTDRFTDEAVKFIEANRKRPFFLYLAHHAVHRPHQAKPALLAKYEKKRPRGRDDDPLYAAVIESVDQSVGRVMTALKKYDIADNTMVVFFSDNGGDTGAGRGTNAPLRGGKGMMYEGGIRVPLAIRWPAGCRGGRTTDMPVLGMDFYPTMLELAGIKPPEYHVLDGESLAPLLRGTGTLKRKAVYWHFPCYLGRTTPFSAIRQGDYKLIETFEDGRVQLFNLKTDIAEKKDLSATLPDKTRALHNALGAWQRATRAEVPVKLNPQYVPNSRPRKGGPRGNRDRRQVGTSPD